MQHRPKVVRTSMHFDAHQKPPDYLRSLFKRYRALRIDDLALDPDILDTRDLSCLDATIVKTRKWRLSEHLQQTSSNFFERSSIESCPEDVCVDFCKAAFEFVELPHLIVVPNLIPLDVQRALLDKLFHRDLANHEHQTNVNLHHHVKYPQSNRSFFHLQPSDTSTINPRDSSTHKPVDVGQFLNRKLRWMTLGGQYDWTNKLYPPQKPPAFPPDLSELLQALFPNTRPEAAIVNLYSPGDTLSMHRDVSEACDHGLVSISIGCDALFVIGLDPAETGCENKRAVIRLRSGDAVYMAGPSRFAWHGVPRIVPDTCPEDLKDWPCKAISHDHSIRDLQYEQWRGWMSSKRINLNVRQMRE